MANPFLNKTELMDRDIETALLLEKAIVTDEKKNATAYCSKDKIFINTEENLARLLPAYDQRMLKWLLWHEKMHLELRHHNRFYKYVDELKSTEVIKEFQITQQEVNIIMDILVHDSMRKMFPELIDTALANFAQMRNQNSLKYTFTTNTLEEMLDEYKAHKRKEDTKSTKEEKESSDSTGEKDKEEHEKTKSKKDEPKDEKDKTKDKKEKSKEKTKGHGAGGDSESHDKAKDTTEPKVEEDAVRPEPELTDEHSKTDWSKLDDIDTKEFITEDESEEIQNAVNKLKRKKFKLAKLTETLNGLITSIRVRTYSKPCSIKVGGGAILKGSRPGRTQLYLVFDASGSMSAEMEMFKDIISKSIPQAMDTTCEWFAGNCAKIKPYKEEDWDGYYKGKFKDFMPVCANNGYSDDGDRTIELCWQAEQLGYSPIGVTDGGGKISWSKDKLMQLKRTVLVGANETWLEKAKSINPKVQILPV